MPVPAITPVRFTGRVSDDELVSWLHAADLTVVPSRSLEGFGLVVLESLACGRPVVVTDAGGLPEAVGGLDFDLVVPAGDPSALRTRLVALATGALTLPSATECRAVAERAEWRDVVARHLPLLAPGDWGGLR